MKPTQKKIIGITGLVIVIVAIVCLVSKPIHNRIQVDQTAEMMRELETKSPKKLTSIKQVQKESNHQLAATVIMKASCKHCRETLAYMKRNLKESRIPFAVIDGNSKQAKSLQAQLSAKQTPCVVVWDKERPVLVYVGNGSKQSTANILRILNNQNVDNHDRPIAALDENAMWYHNDDVNVISQNEIPHLKGFSNGNSPV